MYNVICPMPLPSGATLGPYVVIAPIGAGGMGEVYRARDPRLDRDVALKVLPQHLTSGDEARARFEREAKAIASVSHPNIVAVYDVGRCNSTSYVVLELLEGRTLRDVLATGPMDWRRAADTAIAIANGLAVAHAKGIVHRDLKPENIFITGSSEVKILDFGLAHNTPAATDATAHALTQPGTVLGTPGYMSPEQVRGQTAGAASDIFALGCVMYEMMSGRRAFGRSTVAESLAAILHDAVPEFGSGQYPPELQRIVTRCLDKEPALRFQSARDLSFALQSLSDARANTVLLDSLAVLPFANSGGPDAEYLSEGIAETLINSFSRIPNLRVVPRSVVFRYKDSELGPRALGAAIGARLLLMGRVLHRGNRLSVQAELVDAPAEQQVWGERFNRTTSDIFDVEDEITRQIGERLHVELTRDDKEHIARRSTEDTEAYRLYLKARFHWRRRSTDDMRLALKYLREALEHDPHNAQAHAAVSETVAVMTWYGLESLQQGFQAAEAAARESVRLEDDLAEGHAALGFVRACRGDFAAGQSHLLRAIALNPAYYLAHNWFALVLTALGRNQEALQEMQRARQIDPLSPVIQHHSSWVFYLAHRYQDTLRMARSALELDETYVFGHWWLGQAAVETGDFDQAVPALRRAAALFKDAPLGLGPLGHALARSGQTDEARAVLDQLYSMNESYADPYMIALIHAGLGDAERAIAELRRASDFESVWLRFYGRCDPRWDTIRGHRDFSSIVPR
jgi:serine/threonine protein kinase/tetratricopeptide (TPR) repeat protein